METLQINGIELAYTRRGKGAPLVLLHGYPLDHQIWDMVASMLEDRFDLVLPDLRGFGGSSTTETPYTMNDIAADIAGLLDHLGLPKAAIAGHSMGGYVALAFVHQYPERVVGLGMIASQALADPPERKAGRYKNAEEIATKGIQGVVESMSPKFTPDLRLQAEARLIMARQQPAAYIGALKAMAERSDASTWLAEVKFPVVIVHGDADELIPIDRAREMNAAIPHAHLVELKGVGHLPMLEAPHATTEALRHWLNGVV